MPGLVVSIHDIGVKILSCIYSNYDLSCRGAKEIKVSRELHQQSVPLSNPVMTSVTWFYDSCPLGIHIMAELQKTSKYIWQKCFILIMCLSWLHINDKPFFKPLFDLLVHILANREVLTHCGLVMPYNEIDLGRHWLRQLLLVWRHQAITWTNVDLSSVGFFCVIHLRAISQDVLMNLIKCPDITHSKSLPHLPKDNDLIHTDICDNRVMP